MKPKQLKKLAEAMGVRVEYDSYPNEFDDDVYLEGASDLWQPHKDPAQAMEVLEWMLSRNLWVDFPCPINNDGHCCRALFPQGNGEWQGGVEGEGKTLPEAIVLAALEVLDD